MTKSEVELVCINGYRLGAFFCRNGFKNGGVAIYYKSGMEGSVSEIKNLENISSEKSFEICGIELTNKHNNTIQIFCLYRSPSADVKLFLSELDQFLCLYTKNIKQQIVLCGDFNINLLSNSDQRNELIDILTAYNVNIMTNRPTRYATDSFSAIDYICTNIDTFNNEKCCTIQENGMSDHLAQKLSIRYDYKQTNLGYGRIFSNRNYETFLGLISNETFEDIYQSYSVDDGFYNLIKILQHCFYISFPLKKLKDTIKIDKRWVTTGIRKSSQKLKDLHKLSILSNNQNNIDFYIKYKKIYKKVVKAAKTLDNKRSFIKSNNKSKTTWNIINKTIGKGQVENKIMEIHHEENIITDAKQVAANFNKFFIEKSQALSSSFPTDDSIPQITEKNFKTMFFTPTSENEVYIAINTLKQSNASGIDEISTNLLKVAINFIVRPLTFLINRSLTDSKFPEIFKTAKVIPIYKKDSKYAMENYRPISLLSAVSKILEKIVFNKITHFLCQFNILNNFQHGFRKGRNTCSAILNFINRLYDNLDVNNKCIGLFMDLSKAFDLVNHKLLLEKLNNYGIRGKVSDWISSYLSDRKQVVDINNTKSSEMNINIGVPQGSILGPLLFLIFINDLPNIDPENNIVMFADDNTYLCHDKSKSEVLAKLQGMVTRFIKWFSTNKLHLNISKTVFINFTPRKSLIYESCLIKADHESLRQVASAKFLGLYIDNDLSWKSHVNYLSSKLSSLCFALYRLREVTQKSICLTFYHSNILSRLRYGIIFWGISPHASRLFKLQKRAVRNIVGATRLQSCKPIFKNLNLLPLPCIYIYEVLVYIKNNLAEFISNSDIHSHDTRNKMNFVIPDHNLSLFEKGPKFVGIKCFNKLPDNLKFISNIRVFKKNLFVYLHDNMFYSVAEFLEH